MHPQHSVDLATLKELVFPIARDAIDLPYYEPLSAGPPIMAMFALVLQNEDVARRSMYTMLHSYEHSTDHLIGDTAAMIGDFSIAQRIISSLEERHDRDYADRGYVFDGYEAGDIAVRLRDTSSAVRLMNKFERSDHHYGAALNIALTLGDIDGINRLLRLIMEQALTALRLAP